MEQRAVGDGAGQVGREAAARREHEVDAVDVAVPVEADLVVDDEIMPLAGRDHVVVAVGPDLDGAAMLLRCDRGQCGELVALRLLAAEAAAHAADLDRDGIRGNAKRMRHHVLDFARMLCRGVDRDVMVFARHGQGDLAFEVEMVLPAEVHPALDALRGFLDRRLGVAAGKRQRRRDELALLRVKLGDVEDERQLLIFDLREPRRAPRLFAGFCDDAEDRLAEKLHDAVGEHRLVMAAGRRDVVLARNVLRGQHVDHARRRAHGRQIDLPDPAMRGASTAPDSHAAGPQVPACRRCRQPCRVTCLCAESCRCSVATPPAILSALRLGVCVVIVPLPLQVRCLASATSERI